MQTFSDASLPPSLQGQPFIAMLCVMGLLAGTLLCLQWMYSIVDDRREFPAPKGSPITAVRNVKMFLIFAALVVTLPRLIQLMAWEYLGPWWRESLSLGSWLVYIVWAAFLGSGWWIDRISMTITSMQLRRLPLPVRKAMTKAEKIRSALIFGLIFTVAFSVTYIRPHDAPIYQQHR